MSDEQKQKIKRNIKRNIEKIKKYQNSKNKPNI